MSVAATNSTAAQPQTVADKPPTLEQSFRETIESIAVAFILAFLFRAFVAEAFVIPTGSMAPTLMGAHKDVVCEHCGQQYQAGASSEFDADSGSYTSVVTIASTCSVCRGLNEYNLRANANHATFSGDRILVSKFDYVLHEPERWDVFVFKYYEKARMNYIKRLVGLPGEELLLRDGDVYVKAPDATDWTIARKPPFKIKAMRQLISDTDRRPVELLKQGWPSQWQPLNEADPSWSVVNAEDQWLASIEQPADEWHWLRYYHQFVPEADWVNAQAGHPLPIAEPRTSRLITDYQAYNSSFNAARSDFYNGRKLHKNITEDTTAMDLAVRNAKEVAAAHGADPTQLNQELDEVLENALAIADVRYKTPRDDGPINDGVHWVGDLVGEFWADVKSEQGQLALELVEFGVQYRCTIDLGTGQATLQGFDQGQPLALFDGASELVGDTELRGSGSYRVEFANVDDQLVVWVNGRVIEFSQPAVFDSHAYRKGSARRPYWTSADPLDAAPAGVGARNAVVEIKRARVYRDLYYIAVQDSSSGVFTEYSMLNDTIRMSIPDRELRSRLTTLQAIAAIHSHPEWWEKTPLFSLRGERMFTLAEGQYLPLGDNSAASSDARAWGNHHYIEAEYLLGKALLVFWPHTWNTPVPFTPNFSRMGLIR